LVVRKVDLNQNMIIYAGNVCFLTLYLHQESIIRGYDGCVMNKLGVIYE